MGIIILAVSKEMIWLLFLAGVSYAPHYTNWHGLIDINREFYYDVTGSEYSNDWKGAGDLAKHISDNFVFLQPNFEANWPEDENSAFANMGFTPPSDVASVRFKRNSEELKSWTYVGGPSIEVYAQIEVTLKPNPNRPFAEGIDRVFGTETTLYKAIYDTINVPNVGKWNPNGSGIYQSQEVKVYPMISESQRTATCTRSLDYPLKCVCNSGFDKNEYGECIQCAEGTFMHNFQCVAVDRQTVSCDRENEIGSPDEMGKLQCPPGHSVAVHSATMGRPDTDTCSNNKNSSPSSYYDICTKKSRSCSTFEFVENFRDHCSGKRSCRYELHKFEPALGLMGKKYVPWRNCCKDVRKYITIQYGCAKKQAPMNVEETDMCDSCDDTGYTTENSCDHLPNNDMDRSWQASYVSSYEDCRTQCDNDENCYSFAFYARTGPTPNCYVTEVRGLNGGDFSFKGFSKVCHAQEQFTASRKCEYVKECSKKSERCATSRIPFPAPGPYSWECSEENDVKTCKPVCADGFKNHKFKAMCRTDVNDFEDNWEFVGGDNWDVEFCSNCQNPDAEDEYPVEGGGHYECDVSGAEAKVCRPKCPNGNILHGSISCEWDSYRKSPWIRQWNGDKDMIISHGVSTHVPPEGGTGREDWTLDCDISTTNACEEDKFGDILEEYRKNPKTIAKDPVPDGLTGGDFEIVTKGTSYNAYVKCLDGSRSKTKCSCKTKAKPGKPLKRIFKCKKPTERKDARKCPKN